MRGVMMRGAGIRVAFILMLGVAGAAAQAPIETRGAWSLVAHSQDFALRTQALDGPDNTLSLLCRKEQRQFAYEIKSPSLRVRPSGEDIRISFKADDDDQVWFNISTGPDGTVPISHQTAFWIIHNALTREAAKEVAFTAGDHAFRFSLDGLAGLTEILAQQCGFEASRPEPPARRQDPPTGPLNR